MYDYGKKKEKKVKNVSKSFEIYRLLKELLKYKLLTPEEKFKTPEMKLVYSWWDFFNIGISNTLNFIVMYFYYYYY